MASVHSSGLQKGGLVAAAASVAAAGAGTPLLIAGAALYLYHRNLQANLMTLQEAQEKRDKEIRELEESKSSLEKALLQLNEESQSIVGYSDFGHIVSWGLTNSLSNRIML